MKKYFLPLCISICLLFSVSTSAQVINQVDGLIIDQSGVSNAAINDGTPVGTTNYALKFGGLNSGEAILSPKSPNATVNVNGLDFLTGYNARFRLYRNGDAGFVSGNLYEYASFLTATRSIGINNTTPLAILHVVANPSSAASDNTLVRFQTRTVSSAYSFLNFGKSDYTGSNMFSIDAGTNTSGTSAGTHLLLLGANSSTAYNLGVGQFTSAAPPQSKLHVNGVVQVWGALSPATTMTGKKGMLMGANITSASTSTTGYSWIQSSTGPLLLNPQAGNSMTGAQTNNYVAIGFLPSTTELATLPPSGYNLLVQGKVMCEELKIKLKKDGSGNTVWYDHVFLPSYKLMTLDSLENFILKNNHLPEIPTEAEVQENGIMAGEMNGLLLKKVEELTLYVIEHNKNTATQAEQIELLKKQNELLMEQVKVLVQKIK